MRIGIFAKTFEGSEPARVLAQVKAAGYDCAQYNFACSGLPSMPDVIAPGVAEAVATAVAQTGVTIAAVSGTYNMIHPDPSVREAGHARLEVLARECGAIGAPLITLCTGTRDAHDQWRHHPDNHKPDAWRDLLASMERAIEIAGAHGVDLGVEPELANVVSSAEKARALLDEIASPRVKIVLDPANLFEVEPPDRRRAMVARAVGLLADGIAMAHAKDRTEAGAFATVGRGVIDFRHFAACLHGVGFRGPLVTHGLAAEEAPEVAAFLRGVLADFGVDAA